MRRFALLVLLTAAAAFAACGDNTPDWDAPDAVLNHYDYEWAKCVSRLIDGIESDMSPDAGSWLIAAGAHCTECILNHSETGCNEHREIDRNNPFDPEDDPTDNPLPRDALEDDEE